MNTCIVEDCDYVGFKESTREFAQLRYILEHSNGEVSVPASVLVDIFGFRFNVVSALPIQNDHNMMNQPEQLIHKLMPNLPSRASYEVWKGEDKRDYILNCTGFLSADPYANNDYAFPRTVRPEIADHVSGKSTDEISDFIFTLCRQVTQELESMEDPPCNSPELTAFLHRQGVSIRHIGIIYLSATTEWLRNLIYVEMIARSCKCILYKNLRLTVYQERAALKANIQAASNKTMSLNINYESIKEKLLLTIVSFLNYVFGNSVESQNHWIVALLPTVFIKFIKVDTLPAYSCNPWELFHAVCYHCGLNVNYQGNEPLFQASIPFADDCLKAVPCKVKILLPPSLDTDPEWMYVDALVNKNSGYSSNAFKRRLLFLLHKRHLFFLRAILRMQASTSNDVIMKRRSCTPISLAPTASYLTVSTCVR